MKRGFLSFELNCTVVWHSLPATDWHCTLHYTLAGQLGIFLHLEMCQVSLSVQSVPSLSPSRRHISSVHLLYICRPSASFSTFCFSVCLLFFSIVILCIIIIPSAFIFPPCHKADFVISSSSSSEEGRGKRRTCHCLTFSCCTTLHTEESRQNGKRREREREKKRAPHSWFFPRRHDHFLGTYGFALALGSQKWEKNNS